MPSDSKTVTTPKTKSTRSSLRQSLNLASTVGKAFADVIGKDSREASKNAKKTKDASRRASALISPPAGPRASMGDVRPSSQVSKRTATPDSKVVTRRRVSPTYPDEQFVKPQEPTTPQATAPTRSSTLRPRNLNAASALPKYRPKSAAVECSKPPSPVRAGTRRRLSTSEDEKKEQTRPHPSVSPADKISRPISPLPHRAALKTNLTNSSSVNVTPSTPTKSKVAPASIHKTSPSRPTKMVKIGSTSIPRPPSSTSSSSLNLHTSSTSTPKRSDIKGPFSSARSGYDIAKSGSPHPSPGSSRGSPSPLARRTQKNSTSAASSMENAAGNMSHISECDSEDSEVDDVELLLAPTAALGAPTPAMPRVHKTRPRTAPQTPTRFGLPTRSNLSYLSPLPPDSDGKSSSLRPTRRTPGSDRAARGSILSWEQLASEASKTLGADDLDRMLSDIPAPFRSGAVSPSLSSQMDGPASPCLSAIDSPTGCGSSIAQVILNLPDITPSPAVHYGLQQSRFSLSPDTSSGDAGTITMLRLQLAAADDKSKQTISQLLGLEEEIHNLKQTHVHQMEELQRQVVYLEAQAGAADDHRTSQAASLEGQLRMVQASHERAMEEAVVQTQESLTSSYNHVLKAERRKYETQSSLQLATWGWNTVQETCEMELNVIRDDRVLLGLFLTQLDEMTKGL
ncbi:hypothetical protein BYT27DRAFT_7189386 [Phlegmacium glaucopus]|nr:hypothetical protein BYT27DRAFT_7189386 [Phlegmacium glaucopus]